MQSTLAAIAQPEVRQTWRVWRNGRNAPRTEQEEKSEFPWKLANKILERFQMSKKCKVTESLSIPLRVFARCGFLFFSLYFLALSLSLLETRGGYFYRNFL